MRNSQLVVLLLVSLVSTCVTAKDLQNKECNNAECRTRIIKQKLQQLKNREPLVLSNDKKFTQEQWDSILDSVNKYGVVHWPSNRAIVTQNVSTSYNFSSGYQGVNSEYQEITFEDRIGDKEEASTRYEVENKGDTYDILTIGTIYQETFFAADDQSVWDQVGEARSYYRPEGGEYIEIGNYNVVGAGSVSPIGEQEMSFLQQITVEGFGVGNVSSKSDLFNDFSLTLFDLEEVMTGYEIQDSFTNGEKTVTRLSDVYISTPKLGMSGPVNDTATGIEQSAQGEATFVAYGTGFQSWEDIDHKNVIPKLPLTKLFNFH